MWQEWNSKINLLTKWTFNGHVSPRMIIMSITFLHDQLYVDLLVIEPPWDLHPAAVHPCIRPLSVDDGQGHVSICQPAQQLVPGGLPVTHSPFLKGEDGLGAFGYGHLITSPTEMQEIDALSLGVIPTGQSHIVSVEASDFKGAGRHCERHQGLNWTRLRCNSAMSRPQMHPPSCTHTPSLLHSQALHKYKQIQKQRISTHPGSGLRRKNNKDHTRI